MKSLYFCLASLCFSLLLFTSACTNDNDDPGNEEQGIDSTSLKVISEFYFDATLNDLDNKLTGVFSKDSTEIVFTTKKWIDNISSLVPTFKSAGTVKIEDVTQTSKVTSNDFRKEIIYTVIAKDNSQRNYKVVLKSPQATGLPTVKIDTENGQNIVSKDVYINANISIADPDGKYDLAVTQTEIRGRGNSTWSMPKKPYRLKFKDKTSVFGLPAEKSWVLLANYQDPTLIMNTIAFELGLQFGLPYTNHYNHVELFLNGNYQGSYILTEQIQVKKNRVNISETQGFLVELDSYFDEDPKFETNILKLPVMIKSPDLEDNPGLDLTFVSEAVNKLEAAMFDNSMGFPESGYREMIDMDVFIDFMLVNELVRNVEVKHPKSVYMYKDKGGKIKLGPLWDFDWAFGYEDGSTAYFSPLSKAETMLMTRNDTKGHKFFGRFLEDPVFRSKYKARWNEIYSAKILKTDAFVVEMSEKLTKSYEQNFGIWTNSLPYNTAIVQMREFWGKRVESLNRQINDL